jgi:NAD(P)-dependent dehydrogenase (short-subunit alcohol dehydrogenase family)
MVVFRFSPDDLDAFCRASHDRNPLHISEAYARRTPFGGRVVFGALSALRAIGGIAERPGSVLASAKIDFFGAALTDVDYTVDVEEAPKGRVAARIQDGRRPLLDASFQFRPRPPSALSGERTPPESVPPPRGEPLDRTSSDMAPGSVVRGTYAPSWSEMLALLSRFGVRQSFVDPLNMAVLLWSSYLVGMELPGRRALFGSLAVEFHGHDEPLRPMDYEARVAGTTPRGEHRIEAKITASGRLVASVTITALLCDDAPATNTAALRERLGVSNVLAGKIALITGASRGLGAALAEAFALQGAKVIATYWKSPGEAEQVRHAVEDGPGSIVLRQGDAGDPLFWDDTTRKLGQDKEEPDFVICNASPPIKPLWVEPCALSRLNEFVSRSFGLVSAPLAALLPLVEKRKGFSVLVSSSYVSELPRDFPHYNAAKAAAEALLRTSIAEYRTVSGLIVRPPKLLTDQTNTPSGKKGALATEAVAAAIVSRLLGPRCPGKVELLDSFT